MKTTQKPQPPKVTVPMEVRVLRRQKTCLEKRVRSFSRDRAAVRAGNHVIKWAKRMVCHDSEWNRHQVKMAVKRLEKIENGN